VCTPLQSPRENHPNVVLETTDISAVRQLDVQDIDIDCVDLASCPPYRSSDTPNGKKIPLPSSVNNFFVADALGEIDIADISVTSPSVTPPDSEDLDSKVVECRVVVSTRQWTAWLICVIGAASIYIMSYMLVKYRETPSSCDNFMSASILTVIFDATAGQGVVMLAVFAYLKEWELHPYDGEVRWYPEREVELLLKGK
jgi:hypothetical protein